MKWKAPFLPNSGFPFLNCSLAFVITELSSSFVIVTILSLHYSKILCYWGWIVTQFSLQPHFAIKFKGRSFLLNNFQQFPEIKFYFVKFTFMGVFDIYRIAQHDL